MTQRGVTIIELLITTTLWAIISISIIPISKRLQTHLDLYLNSHRILTELHDAKLRAQLSGDDQQIDTDQNTLRFKSNNTEISQLKLPQTIRIEKSKQNIIGFKANGNTQFAGTITLQAQNLRKKVTVSVGPGRIHRR